MTQSLGMLYEDMSKHNNMRLQKQLTNQKEYSNQIIDFVLNDFKRFPSVSIIIMIIGYLFIGKALNKRLVILM